MRVNADSACGPPVARHLLAQSCIEQMREPGDQYAVSAPIKSCGSRCHARSRKRRPQGPLQGRASKPAVASPAAGEKASRSLRRQLVPVIRKKAPKVADISLPADDPPLDSKGEDHGKPADAESGSRGVA